MQKVNKTDTTIRVKQTEHRRFSAYARNEGLKHSFALRKIMDLAGVPEVPESQKKTKTA